jgi:methionyl-tRNA formyltransferase
MRIILVGAVESTRVAFQTMAREGLPPVALVTLPHSRSGRHSDYVALQPLAAELSIPVIATADVNQPKALVDMRALDPDYIFVIGWSQICREQFRSIPRLGCIGFHPAPLPENRGRAVIPWTILQRRAETGSTIFWLDDGVDSGDILAQSKFPVSQSETAITLYRKHLQALEQLLTQALSSLRQGKAPCIAQDHSRASYCAKRTAADGWIDWNQSADSVWTLIRAVGRPYPGAFTFMQGRKMIVWEAELIGTEPFWGLPGQVQVIRGGGALVQCGDRGHVLLTKVQVQAEPEMGAGGRLKVHERLGYDLKTMMTSTQTWESAR